MKGEYRQRMEEVGIVDRTQACSAVCALVGRHTAVVRSAFGDNVNSQDLLRVFGLRLHSVISAHIMGQKVSTSGAFVLGRDVDSCVLSGSLICARPRPVFRRGMGAHGSFPGSGTEQLCDLFIAQTLTPPSSSCATSSIFLWSQSRNYQP